MIKFCRHCGSELAGESVDICPSCGSHAVKATEFCRHCGRPTTKTDTVCGHCGAATKPIPAKAWVLSDKTKRLVKAGKIINLVLIITAITLYVVFALPHKFKKSVSMAADDAVMATTGYTALPIRNIVAVPNGIPPLHFREGARDATPIATNATRQLTIYAVRIDNTNNSTVATRLDDVTANCSFFTSNEKIATVNASGFVQVRSAGQANITASFTGPAGTSNLSNASAGKVPVTFTVNVLVNAAAGGIQ